MLLIGHTPEQCSVLSIPDHCFIFGFENVSHQGVDFSFVTDFVQKPVFVQRFIGDCLKLYMEKFVFDSVQIAKKGW